MSETPEIAKKAAGLIKNAVTSTPAKIVAAVVVTSAVLVGTGIAIKQIEESHSES